MFEDPIVQESNNVQYVSVPIQPNQSGTTVFYVQSSENGTATITAQNIPNNRNLRIHSGAILPNNISENSGVSNIAVERKRAKSIVNTIGALQMILGIINTGGFLTIFCLFIILLIVVLFLLVEGAIMEWWLVLMGSILMCFLCVPIWCQFFVGGLSFRQRVNKKLVTLAILFVIICCIAIIYSFCILLYKIIEISIRLGFSFNHVLLIFIYLIFLACICPCCLVSILLTFYYKKYLRVAKLEEEKKIEMEKLRVEKRTVVIPQPPPNNLNIPQHQIQTLVDVDMAKQKQFTDRIYSPPGFIHQNQTQNEKLNEEKSQFNPQTDFQPANINFNQNMNISSNLEKESGGEEKEKFQFNPPMDLSLEINEIESSNVSYKEDITNHIQKM